MMNRTVGVLLLVAMLTAGTVQAFGGESVPFKIPELGLHFRYPATWQAPTLSRQPSDLEHRQAGENDRGADWVITMSDPIGRDQLTLLIYEDIEARPVRIFWDEGWEGKYDLAAVVRGIETYPTMNLKGFPAQVKDRWYEPGGAVDRDYLWYDGERLYDLRVRIPSRGRGSTYSDVIRSWSDDPGLAAFLRGVERIMGTMKLGGGSYARKISCDLDGDGVEESIGFAVLGDRPERPETCNRFAITIDGRRTVHLAEAPSGFIGVVDIDTTDSFQELAVTEYGPSDDPATYFFRFTNGELVELGQLPGMVGNRLLVDGSGMIVANCRGRVLHTWWHSCCFRVGTDGTFEPFHETYYPMNDRLTLREELPLFASRGDSVVAEILPAGTPIVVLGSDDVRWCLVAVDDRTRGWFELEDFRTLADGRRVMDVFEGLRIAD